MRDVAEYRLQLEAVLRKQGVRVEAVPAQLVERAVAEGRGVELVTHLEQRMTEALEKRCLDREERQEFKRLAFFQRKVSDGHVAFPIDEAVEWSRTGGRQFVLLDVAPEGCVRWGLCDTGGAA